MLKKLLRRILLFKKINKKNVKNNPTNLQLAHSECHKDFTVYNLQNTQIKIKHMRKILEREISWVPSNIHYQREFVLKTSLISLLVFKFNLI